MACNAPQTGRSSGNVGMQVRVKPGVRDPDYPDSQLDGWIGTVEQFRAEPGRSQYLIAWNGSTLRRMDPLLKLQSALDGLDEERMWLDVQAVEQLSEPGQPLAAA